MAEYSGYGKSSTFTMLYWLSEDESTPYQLSIQDVQIAIANSLGTAGSRAFEIIRRISLEDDWQVYLVGGPVRDVLLGKDINDLDFGVAGDAFVLSSIIALELGGEVINHPQFLTASVIAQDIRIDIATSRKESYPSHGLLPQVAPGSIFDDLSRRDFSINAMAFPLWQEQPQLLDPHDGLIDLNARLIRVLHSDSFNDDPTRMFRAVKYESRFGFRITSDSLSTMLSALTNGVMARVSGERIIQEIDRIFLEPKVLEIIARSRELGLMKAIQKSWMTSPFPFEGFEELKLRIHDDPMSCLVAICWDLGYSKGELLINRLNMPKVWSDLVRDTASLRSIESELSSENILPSEIYSLLESIADTVIKTGAILTENQVFESRLSFFTDTLMGTSPILNGDDLIVLGIPEGPLIGDILKLLKDRKLDREIITELDERNFVESFLKSSLG